MSAHVGHIHFWEIFPAHTRRWLEKHVVTAASTVLVLAVAGIGIATEASRRDPIRFLDAVDEITTCKMTLIVWTEQDDNLSSSVWETVVFDRHKGSTTRFSRDGVTERIEVDDGVDRSIYAAGGDVVRSVSLHSLGRLKKKLHIEDIRSEKWDVVYSKTISSDGPMFYRRFHLKGRGSSAKELDLTVSRDNRLTNLQYRQHVEAIRPMKLVVIANFDTPVKPTWFVADGTNPMFGW